MGPVKMLGKDFTIRSVRLPDLLKAGLFVGTSKDQCQDSFFKTGVFVIEITGSVSVRGGIGAHDKVFLAGQNQVNNGLI